MKTSYVFLAEGFEEVEALTSVDLLRRAGMDVKTVTISDSVHVTGAHGVTVIADVLFVDVDWQEEAEWLILPGGMPGASNLAAHKGLCELLLQQNARGEKLAAICASPAVVLAPLGLLKGKKAVCYPGFEGALVESKPSDAQVVVDGNVVTGNGPAAASEFALSLIGVSLGEDAAKKVADGMLLVR